MPDLLSCHCHLALILFSYAAVGAALSIAAIIRIYRAVWTSAR